MPTLSRRGRSLLDAPPLAPYVTAHAERQDGQWDPRDRPDGYIGLCIAENKRMCEPFLELLRRADVPSGALAYDAMVGSLEFRRALAAFMSRTFLGRTVEPEQLAVLAGAGSVLEQLFWVICDPGDGVLVPTPSYAGFWTDLETRDAVHIIGVHGDPDDGFCLRVDRLEAALREADRPVRALLLTSPDNPMGRVHEASALAEVADWARHHRLHLVFDEVYALSVFGEQPFVSGASLRPRLGPDVHVVWAFSKDFGASGLRCGVLVSENDEVLGAIDQLAYWSSCSGHTQALLRHVVADTAAVDHHLRRTREDLGALYGLVTTWLDDAGFDFIPAQAGFFVLCDLRRFLDEPTPQAEHRLWRRMLDHAAVNLTPGSACRIPTPGFFRLCYAGVHENAVEEGIRRVAALLQPRPS